MCRGCGKKGHFETVCLKSKHSTHSLEVPQASTGATAGEALYFNDDGELVFAHMVSVLNSSKYKHVIKFPIALDHADLRNRNKVECSTMLLKADMGANVNWMNKQTFNQLFGGQGKVKAKDVLKPTPIRMENYGNTAVKVLGMFHAFLRWKD